MVPLPHSVYQRTSIVVDSEELGTGQGRNTEDIELPSGQLSECHRRSYGAFRMAF